MMLWPQHHIILAIIAVGSALSSGDEFNSDLATRLRWRDPHSRQPFLQRDIVVPELPDGHKKFQFYVQDENGQLVQEWFTLQEIQDFLLRFGPILKAENVSTDSSTEDPEDSIHQVIASVQQVISEEVAQTQRLPVSANPYISAPDPTSTTNSRPSPVFGESIAIPDAILHNLLGPPFFTTTWATEPTTQPEATTVMPINDEEKTDAVGESLQANTEPTLEFTTTANPETATTEAMVPVTTTEITNTDDERIEMKPSQETNADDAVPMNDPEVMGSGDTDLEPTVNDHIESQVTDSQPMESAITTTAATTLRPFGDRWNSRFPGWLSTGGRNDSETTSIPNYVLESSGSDDAAEDPMDEEGKPDFGFTTWNYFGDYDDVKETTDMDDLKKVTMTFMDDGEEGATQDTSSDSKIPQTTATEPSVIAEMSRDTTLSDIVTITPTFQMIANELASSMTSEEPQKTESSPQGNYEATLPPPTVVPDKSADSSTGVSTPDLQEVMEDNMGHTTDATDQYHPVMSDPMISDGAMTLLDALHFQGIEHDEQGDVPFYEFPVFEAKPVEASEEPNNDVESGFTTQSTDMQDFATESSLSQDTTTTQDATSWDPPTAELSVQETSSPSSDILTSSHPTMETQSPTTESSSLSTEYLTTPTPSEEQRTPETTSQSVDSVAPSVVTEMAEKNSSEPVKDDMPESTPTQQITPDNSTEEIQQTTTPPSVATALPTVAASEQKQPVHQYYDYYHDAFGSSNVLPPDQIGNSERIDLAAFERNGNGSDDYYYEDYFVPPVYLDNVDEDYDYKVNTTHPLSSLNDTELQFPGPNATSPYHDHHHDEHHGHHDKHHPQSQSGPPAQLLEASQDNLGLESSLAGLDPDVKKFVDVMNDVTFKVYKRAARQYKRKNFVMSPLSLISTLSMLLLGARGKSSEALSDLLQTDQFYTFNPHLILKNITESLLESDKIHDVALLNQFLVEKAKKPYSLDFFARTIQFFYGATVEEVEPFNFDAYVRERVNHLVRNVTFGAVQDFLLPEEPLYLTSPLSAVSTNFFHGRWSLPVTQGDLFDMDFLQFPTAERRLVRTVGLSKKMTINAGYSSVVGATSAEIPYYSEMGDLSLVLVMPGKQKNFVANGLAQLESAMSPAKWSQILRSMLPNTVQFKMPVFRHRAFHNFSDILMDVGLREVFEADKADFSGINNVKGLHLSDVVQLTEFQSCQIEEPVNENPASSRFRRSPQTFSADETGPTAFYRPTYIYGLPMFDYMRKAEAEREQGQYLERESEAMPQPGRGTPTGSAPWDSTPSGSSPENEEEGWTTGLRADSLYRQDWLDSLLSSQSVTDENRVNRMDIPHGRMPSPGYYYRQDDAGTLAFDRAFLYAVRHNPTGLLLFIGRYLDPAAS